MNVDRHPKLIVAGEEVQSARAPIRSPFDDREVGSVPVASAAHVESAIARAASAAASERISPRKRHISAHVLDRAAQIVAAHQEPLARLISDEAGKPIALARVEAARCIDTLCAARDVARTEGGEALELSAHASAADRLGVVRRFAVGAIAAITPFNFPLNLVAHKLAPAIAAGCPVVLKPSPQAPLSSFALARILFEAGLPPEHLSVVPTTNDLAAPLVEDDRLRMLTFTGSAKVGWALRARCGEKRCTLELGGNAAVVVHDDADLGRASDRIAVGAHAYAGQSCISVQRVYAHRRIHDELRARLLDRQTKIVVGDPSRDDVVCGPVIDDVAVRRIRATLDEAMAEGARASGPLELDRRVIRPIMLENVGETSKASAEEIFAPVLVLAAYHDFEDALARVDGTRWGLQAGIFTRDLDRVMRAFERLEVGGLVHDDVPTFRADAMPYGGVKSSGLGREGPKYAFEEMTERRLLLLRPARTS